jgi:hypothetical protein
VSASSGRCSSANGASSDDLAEAKTQICAGELVHWPKEVPHRLWTESSQMTTLMFEREAA